MTVVVSLPTPRRSIGYFEESGGGTVYIYEKPDNGWVDMEPNAKLSPSNSTEFDLFGSRIAQDDDVVVITASLQGEYGEVYVFNKPTTGWRNMTETQRIVPQQTPAFRAFGSHLAIDGDDLFINTRHKVHVYTKTDGTWNGPIAELWDGTVTTAFGADVHIKDGTLLIADPYYDYGSRRSISAAYIYEKPATGWTSDTPYSSLLLTEDSVSSSLSTYSIEFNGNVIAMTPGQPSDSVHLYYKPENGWGSSDVLYPDTILTQGFTRFSMKMSESDIFVGNSESHETGFESGHLKIYTDFALVTSIEPEIAQSDLKIYPNPTQDRIWIASERLINGAIISITDLQGNTLLSEQSTITSDDKVSLDVSQLKAGTYILTLQRNSDISSTKIVVQR